MLGKTLAHYTVIAHLGSGGMGEVYRAHDSKLDREVALKTLLPELLNDPERIARFERETRSLATLQHANVASIYGWEETPEARFLVMKLVEGENLAERIKRGAGHNSRRPVLIDPIAPRRATPQPTSASSTDTHKSVTTCTPAG
jgi:serine/threonine protein kinase